MSKLKQFLTNVIDDALPMGAVVRDRPYTLVFKTTNYCWYKCPHCCESSGPDQAKYYIPYPVIRNWLVEASQDKMFSGNVVFTGGEIFSAYRFGDKSYVPNLLKTALDYKMGVDIKTNAAWSRTTWGEEIFKDLTDIINSYPPYSMEISLSLDNYHKNSVDNAARVISRLARNKCHVRIYLSTFRGHENLYDQLRTQLRKSHTPVTKRVVLRQEDGSLHDVDAVRNSVILRLGDAVDLPFDNGRAKNLPETYHTKFPQFAFLSKDLTVMMAFDVMGRVTLGENSGRKINTSYIGRNHIQRHISDIRRDLISSARVEEVRASIFENWQNPLKSR